jgi:transcriptional regulator with XRE-family HTH domain
MLSFNHVRLRQIRLERRWSPDDAARRWGVSYPMARKLESGEARPSIATLGRIVRALGVPMDSLFVETPVDPEESSVATDLGEATDRWIEKTLKTAPPLSEEQARRISAVLFAPHTGARGGDHAL